MYCWVSQKSIHILIESLLLNFQFPFILNRAYSNLDFEIKIVEICCELIQTYYFKFKHTKLYKPNFGDF